MYIGDVANQKARFSSGVRSRLIRGLDFIHDGEDSALVLTLVKTRTNQKAVLGAGGPINDVNKAGTNSEWAKALLDCFGLRQP